MAIVARKRAKGVTYYVVFEWEGKPVWERSGTERRAAEQLETKRKREILNGTYAPQAGTTRATTVRQYADTWGERRTNRSASDDRQRLRDHVVSREWFSALRIEDIRVVHIKRLVDELVGSGIAGKTVSNVYGAVRTMLRDARIEELLARDPCVLPKNYIKRSRTSERQPYTRAEATSLTTDPRIDNDRRIFCALGLYLGVREGELCGLRFRDWDRDARPLGCMSILSQYGGEVLKTERPRKVPVHPALAEILQAWISEGFELVHCRKPTPDDFIVPMRARKANHHGVKPHHTKSSAYKLFIAACEQAGVANRSLHSTRHTMITWARRGGARKEMIERVTHNAKGDIVDQYTHFDWAPLCEAVLAIAYLDAHQDLHRGGNSPRNSGGTGAQSGSRMSVEVQGTPGTLPDSIPGASTGTSLKNKLHPKTRQSARQVGSVGRLMRECVALATGAMPAGDPEAEVARRLRRVVKALPRLSEPVRTRRGQGGAA